MEIRESGRSGSVIYFEGAENITFHWEFCGGETVASIWIGESGEWNARHPWAAGWRQEILEHIAEEVVRLKAPTCSALIEERSGFIAIKQRPAGSEQRQ
ncbi:hypothetical protein KBY93_12790 [Synechococcus sp. J7-Johnson]|uniref:hypothetical protein n=1 Tax=Synechococcus sp. J7-Johnson TaxID=2823737 RepID=UPI0020CC7879|nr:hypothetical protein [Synechococcus sp. J7-Johnson]MCP9841504.1 hypothetical protein [Synechococcus sp. J7-Johnson]